MSKVDIRVCDRCDFPIDDEERTLLILTRPKAAADATLDLCADCDFELRDFLKGDCGCGKGAGCPDRG